MMKFPDISDLLPRRVCLVSSWRQIDLLGQLSEYPFLNRFLYAPEDPVKQKWAFVKEWSEQCRRSPKVSEKQFKILRQRYGTSSPLIPDNYCRHCSDSISFKFIVDVNRTDPVVSGPHVD